MLKQTSRVLLNILVGGAVLASIAAPGLVNDAHATGFLVARMGGEHGTPMTDDPTALYYNPAGIAWRTAPTSTSREPSPIAARHSIATRPPWTIPTRRQARAGTPDPSINSGKGTLGNFLVSPFIGVTSDLGIDGLGVGLSFSTPFGGSASWNKVASNTLYPGAVDGPQRWGEIEGTIRSSYITAGAAYRLGDRVSVGIGANLVLSVIDDIRAQNADGTDDTTNSAGGVKEGRALINVSNTTVSASAGITWRPLDNLILGASYQSQPGFGTMTLSGTLEKKLGSDPETSSKIDVTQALPDVIRVGGAYRPASNVEIRLWGDFERWSVFTGQCIMDATVAGRNCALDANGAAAQTSAGIILNIPRYWHDAVDLRASGSYWLGDLELQFGVGFDGNAVPDSTIDAALPDQNKVSATVGVTWTGLDKKLVLSANITQFVYLSRTVAPRDGVEPFLPPSRVPDEAGTYDQSVSVGILGVGYKF